MTRPRSRLAPRTKPRLKPRIPRIYDVLCEAAHSGAVLGWRRAHKHTDDPSEDYGVEQIERAMIEALVERVELDDE